MHCKRHENEIALFISDDLPAHEVPALQQHLQECEVCRAFEQSLRDSLDVTHSLVRITIPDAPLAEIRQRVLNEIAQIPKDEPAAYGMTRALLIAATALLLVSVGLVTSRSSDHPATVPAEPIASMAVAPPASVERVESRIQSASVKLYTDNPNVVFYLVSDNNGG